MPKFTGNLKANEIFAAIYNMIISQEVFTDNIDGLYDSLANQAKVDGGLYGDTKLYYAGDILKSAEWGNDAEAENLLKLHRPKAPECQSISIDKFRQISLTTDSYLTKRAWGDEGVFSKFNSMLKGTMQDTRAIYDATIYNCYFGTTETAVGRQTLEIELPKAAPDATAVEIEATNRLEAQTIAEFLANLMVDLKDNSRDFNDYKFMRSYGLSKVKIVWNSKYINKIKKIDMPTIFHNNGLVDKFAEEVLPARFFGKVNEAQTAGDGVKVRSLIEQDINGEHLFPGDLIPSGQNAPANTSYTTDENIICKVVTKLPPYMSAFSVGTSFYNAKSLTTNDYLTWGHNTLEYFKDKPFITIKKKA